MTINIRARCSAQHRKSLAIESALGGGQAIENVSGSTADPGLPGNLPAFQSTAVSTPLSGVIATFLPEWRSLRTAFERTRNPIARAVRIFLQGHAGTLNFCRAFEAAGKPFLRALFQSPEKPLSIAFVLLGKNHLSLLAADHGNNHAAGEIGNAQKCLGEFRNVVR